MTVHSFTPEDRTMLNAVEKGLVSVTEAAIELHCSRTSIYHWLAQFGMSYPPQKHGRRTGSTNAHKRAIKKCVYCEILLSEAPEGYEGDLCNYCWEQLLDQLDGKRQPAYDDALLVALEDLVVRGAA